MSYSSLSTLVYFNTSHVNVNLLPQAPDLSVRPISIHLMLMLIILIGLYFSRNIYFNTSHVNVNQTTIIDVTDAYSDFNTSHVNVNPDGRLLKKCKTAISIHLMLMLIRYSSYNSQCI